MRSIRMTLSLAFLAPEIVKAAVKGRLPRGFGLKRLVKALCRWLGFRTCGGRGESVDYVLKRGHPLLGGTPSSKSTSPLNAAL